MPSKKKRGGIHRTWWEILITIISALDSYSEYLLIRNETRLLKAYAEMEKSEHKEDIKQSIKQNVERVSGRLKTSIIVLMPFIILLVAITIIF